MSFAGERWVTAQLIGVGPGVAGVKVFDAPTFGVVRSLIFHNEFGSNATELSTFLLVHRVDQFSAFPPPAFPRPGLRNYYATGIVLTASATDASWEDLIERPRGFSDGLGVVAFVECPTAQPYEINVDIELGALRYPTLSEG